MLDSENQVRRDERERILNERVPALQLSGLSAQDLQVSAEESAAQTTDQTQSSGQ